MSEKVYDFEEIKKHESEMQQIVQAQIGDLMGEIIMSRKKIDAKTEERKKLKIKEINLQNKIQTLKTVQNSGGENDGGQPIAEMLSEAEEDLSQVKKSIEAAEEYIKGFEDRIEEISTALKELENSWNEAKDFLSGLVEALILCDENMANDINKFIDEKLGNFNKAIEKILEIFNDKNLNIDSSRIDTVEKLIGKDSEYKKIINEVAGDLKTSLDGKSLGEIKEYVIEEVIKKNGELLATRKDDGNDVEIYKFNGKIYFTSVARSCDDGLLPEGVIEGANHQDNLTIPSGIYSRDENGNLIYISKDPIVLQQEPSIINPYNFPYVVLPEGHNLDGVKKGDVIGVNYNGQTVYGVYIENGPDYRIGEVSMKIQEELFGNASTRLNGSSNYDVTYIVYPGSSKNLTGRDEVTQEIQISDLTYDYIQEIGRELSGR